MLAAAAAVDGQMVLRQFPARQVEQVAAVQVVAMLRVLREPQILVVAAVERLRLLQLRKQAVPAAAA